MISSITGVEKAHWTIVVCSVGCIAHADAGGNRKQTKDSEFHKRHTISYHQRVRMPNLHVSQGTRLIIRLICVRALALRLLSTPVCMRRSQLCMALLKVKTTTVQKSNNVSARCIVQEPEDTALRLVSFLKVLCAQNTIEQTECKVLRSKPPISPTEYDALRLLSLNCVILKGCYCAPYQGTVKQPSSLPEGIGQRSTLFGPSM